MTAVTKKPKVIGGRATRTASLKVKPRRIRGKAEALVSGQERFRAY